MVRATPCLSGELLLGKTAVILAGLVYLGSVLSSSDLCKSGQMQWDFQEKNEKEKLVMLLETHPFFPKEVLLCFRSQVQNPAST